ncbi:MAG TPA: helix-turn-helix transcriptional regulator [Thermoanaerobaculia bacterium]|nr:helix-turn-helix transcriptional regulator [Thermoanaerobaculia bacterium]
MTDMRPDVEAYLRECFASESSPRVTELALRLGVSRGHLHVLFIDRFGVTPSAFLKQRQLEHAQDLLRSTGLSSAAIAYRCGFGSRRTMFRTFQREMATTPSALRRAPDQMSLSARRRKRVQRFQRSK